MKITGTMKLLILAAFLMVVGCSEEDEPRIGGSGSVSEDPAGASVARNEAANGEEYTFDQPALSFVLADELRENSGLAILPNGQIGTVQDEDGIVYALNPETGTIEAEYPFGESGDYEGIEWVGDRGFVLRSDGTLIELVGWPDDVREAQTYETSLKRKNDAEGLGYDAASGRLLIACKEDPGAGLDEGDERAIYAFDPETGELTDDPVYVIDLRDIEELASRGGAFRPSAVAVHPSNGDVYVLSGPSQALAILTSGGDLKSVHTLDRSMFEQPEGLAFTSDGTLYISSEGSDGPPMLYRFAPGAGR